mmetsp:Transcript_7632/g.12352  ORF Transcript_7632/g.12352 Transcript_7632/m.12352 type:complete len:98 (+) Transcript_7632:114-407(+)
MRTNEQWRIEHANRCDNAFGIQKCGIKKDDVQVDRTPGSFGDILMQNRRVLRRNLWIMSGFCLGVAKSRPVVQFPTGQSLNVSAYNSILQFTLISNV